jgi:hypothetical protein
MTIIAASPRHEILDIVVILRGMIRSNQIVRKRQREPCATRRPDIVQPGENPILFQGVRITVKEKKKYIFGATIGAQGYSKWRQ